MNGRLLYTFAASVPRRRGSPLIGRVMWVTVAPVQRESVLSLLCLYL